MTGGAHRDLGAPIAYLVLEPGVPVLASDAATEIGTVRRVLAVPEDDIFDGLLLDTPEGERFVDADNVGAIHERGVVLSLSAEAGERLPEPSANPGALSASPGDVDGSGVTDAIRRAWDRISGRY